MSKIINEPTLFDQFVTTCSIQEKLIYQAFEMIRHLEGDRNKWRALYLNHRAPAGMADECPSPSPSRSDGPDPTPN